MVIRANDEVLPQFLFQILKSEEIIKQLQLLAETRSGTFPQITFSELAALDVRIPSIAEQRRNSLDFEVIDDKIANNTAINHHLEQMALAIFKSWFVDFEPFGGEQPSEWQTGSLTEIRRLPQRFSNATVQTGRGRSWNACSKIKELRQGSCDSSSARLPNIRSDYIVHDGDVVFYGLELLVYFWCGGDCGLNQHLFKVTSHKYNKWFYYAWTCHHLAQFVAMAADKATTMGHIKREALENADVIIPDKDS